MIKEPFKVAPNASIGAIPLLGYALMFIAIPLNFLLPLANIIFEVFLLLFALVQIFKYLGWFDFLFPKKISHNIYTIMDPPSGSFEKTLIFSGHINSSWNWNLALKSPTRMWVKVPYGILSAVILMILSLLHVLDSANLLHLWSPWLNLIIIGLIPGFWYLMHYLSWNPKIASPGAMDNLTGVFMVLWLLKYFHEHTEEIPANTRLLFATFGAEESGNKGAKAFVDRHRADLLQNASVINIDGVSDFEYFVIIEGDVWLGINYDPTLVHMAQESMQENDAKPGTPTKNPVGGTDASMFSKRKIPAVTLIAQNPIATDYYHTQRDKFERLNPRTLEKMNQIVLTLVKKWESS